jgi:hypothetical protein
MNIGPFIPSLTHPGAYVSIEHIATMTVFEGEDGFQRARVHCAATDQDFVVDLQDIVNALAGGPFDWPSDKPVGGDDG